MVREEERYLGMYENPVNLPPIQLLHTQILVNKEVIGGIMLVRVVICEGEYSERRSILL